MSGATLGKVAAAARPRRKVLSAEEAELFELAQAAGSGLDPEVFKVLLDLLRMNVAPLAVFQVLKSMCAGQRLPAGTESGAPAAPAPLPADNRVFQGENFTVADEYMLTREEFCSKTEKENFCQQPLCWEHRTMEKRKPWLSV
uniref:Mitotic spindle organizing protein 2A n=1 Tax=Anser brachyrhynchus TaxID=132585 RepID=A0A8B9I6M3_9AVES